MNRALLAGEGELHNEESMQVSYHISLPRSKFLSGREQSDSADASSPKDGEELSFVL